MFLTTSILFCPTHRGPKTLNLMPCLIYSPLSPWPRNLSPSFHLTVKVKQANGETPPPSGCPDNRLFVPTNLRPQVIHWAHLSLFTGHPGVRQTMFAITQRFWWPSNEPEVREYVEACPVCARNKTSSRARAGLLQPLPIPSRPWTEISMDRDFHGLRYRAPDLQG